MDCQDLTPETGKPECLMTMTGQDLMGVPLTAPNAVYERIYVLPLLTILMNKGTGIVTSVPSDSPDDYTALMVSSESKGCHLGDTLALAICSYACGR